MSPSMEARPYCIPLTSNWTLQELNSSELVMQEPLHVLFPEVDPPSMTMIARCPSSP